MKEKLCIWLAWHLLPRRLVYWCAIRLFSSASAAHLLCLREVGTITCVEALKEWKI